MTKKSICDTLRRTCLILAGSFIMAVNLKSFVRAGGLIPGGFNGLTRLIQEISVLLWHWEPPFSVINFILNAVPVVISFKFIGKKFTGYSCLMIVVSGILTDMVPAWPVTEDILLIAIFGGLINAGRGLVGTECRDAHSGQRIDHAQRQRVVLGDDDIVKGFFLGKFDHGVHVGGRDGPAVGVIADAAVAGRTPDLGAAGAFFQRTDDGVLTPAAADNQNFHKRPP